MTETAAHLVAELDRLDRERDAVMVRLRALTSVTAAPTAGSSRRRHIEAAKAFREAGFVSFDDDKIQRICRKHSREWAIKLGRWHVTEPDFSRFAEDVKSGKAKFKL